MKKFLIKKILQSYAITIEDSEPYRECAKRLNGRTTLQLLYSYIRYQLLNLC